MRARIMRSPVALTPAQEAGFALIVLYNGFYYYLAGPDAVKPDTVDVQLFRGTWGEIRANDSTIADRLLRTTYRVNATGLVFTKPRQARPASGTTILADWLAPIMFAGDDPA